jgi:hypothetical protein
MHALFANPPREFGMMPFWFWNDDLEDGEIVRQIREFHAKGCGGFIPHARIGLSHRVGYLTPEYFRILRLAVEEAARLGMKVVLYDEGSYPSGSAQGRVVAENPAYASRCLIALHHSVVGPATGYWRPNPGRAQDDRLLCVVAARETAPDQLDPASFVLLPIAEHELVRYELPAGTWRLVAVWNVQSGGRIRGVFAEEDDAHALAPAAGDILNPAAVSCFIRHTHDQFHRYLGEHFGKTIIAMFTDEPGPLGRGPQRGPQPQPFTDGFLDDLRTEWSGDVLPWLPALWLDCGVRTTEFRDAYRRALHARLNRVFYGAQARWCEEHGIALTGHPERSDEMSALAQFDWPGQDMVWRYIEPAKPTALEGPHSTAAKAAHSAAVLAGRRFNTSEVCGAYGWQLTLDEAKWLFDWHLVRGNNLFFSHAVFYSIRGRRAFESEPDLGVHNVWWPHWGLIGDHVRRLCWLFADGTELCDAVILADPDRLPWQAAKALYQAQVSFVYADSATLQSAEIAGGELRLGPSSAAGVAIGGRSAPERGKTHKECDQPQSSGTGSVPQLPERAAPATLEGACPPAPGCVAGSVPVRTVLADPPELLTPELRAKLAAFAVAGGTVISDWTPENLPAQLARLPQRLVRWSGSPDLRMRPYRKHGLDLFLLVNEGEGEISGNLTFGRSGQLELWDPLTGQVRPWPGQTQDGRTCTHLRLERRQAVVLVLNPERPSESPALQGGAGILPATAQARRLCHHGVADSATAATPDPVPGEVVQELAGPWAVSLPDGQRVAVPVPGDWARVRELELFSGTLCYRAEFAVSAEIAATARFLDLGRVGDIADVTLNGRPLGVRAWAPYVLPLPAGRLRAGTNALEVRVTNSMANACDGRQFPSGLLSPVRLRGGCQ